MAVIEIENGKAKTRWSEKGKLMNGTFDIKRLRRIPPEANRDPQNDDNIEIPPGGNFPKQNPPEGTPPAPGEAPDK